MHLTESHPIPSSMHDHMHDDDLDMHMHRHMDTYVPHVAATIGHAEDPNVRHRPSMEDEFSLHVCESLPAVFLAVYDGHGGRAAATLLQSLFHRLFLDELADAEAEAEAATGTVAGDGAGVQAGTGTGTGTGAETDVSVHGATNKAATGTRTTDTTTHAHAHTHNLHDDVHSACSTPPYDDALLSSTHASPSLPNGLNSHGTTPSPLQKHTAHAVFTPKMMLSTATSTTTPSIDYTLHAAHSAWAPAAFRAAYIRMDAHLRLRNCMRTGATAATLFLHRTSNTSRMLTIANVGDTHAVLSRAGRPHRLTTDHRASDASERIRIEDAGGFITCGRVNGVLNVARAFGDHCMKSLIPATPCVSQVVLGELDDFLILACDGFWDFVDDSVAVSLAQLAFDRGLSATQVARELVHEALARRSSDNVSVMVVHFDMLV